MTGKWLCSLGVAAALLGPSAAWGVTFSFGGGTLNPGEQITSITLGPRTSPGSNISYSQGTGILTINAFVSKIFTNQREIDVTTSVEFNSQLTIVSQTFVFPGLPGGSAIADFDFGAIDFSIIDWDATSGGFPAPELLMEADFSNDLRFSANNGAFVQGSLGGESGGVDRGEFAVLGGNADFTDAYGGLGTLTANLDPFFQSSGAQAIVLCPDMVDGNCFTPPPGIGLSFKDWTANPNITLSRTTAVVPEPAVSLLLAMGLLSLILLRS